MFAVIESGGKQHRVEEGEILRLEKLAAGPGETVTFDRVLLIAQGDDIKVGTPFVDGGEVTAEVVGEGRGEKITALSSSVARTITGSRGIVRATRKSG